MNIDVHRMCRSQIGEHILDIVGFFLFLLVGDLYSRVDIDVLPCDLLLLVVLDFVHEIGKHLLSYITVTSTYSSSESLSSISFILSSIYFCLILASAPSRIISCILSEYFSCSFMCSVTLSKASIVSMSMTACSSWNFLSTRTFFLRV